MSIGGITDLAILKSALYGQNFKNLLKKKSVTIYRMSKDTGITHQTLRGWKRGAHNPSDELALRAGKYLGLVDEAKLELIELKKSMNDISSRIRRLEA